jgi:hypothetical protein
MFGVRLARPWDSHLKTVMHTDDGEPTFPPDTLDRDALADDLYAALTPAVESWRGRLATDMCSAWFGVNALHVDCSAHVIYTLPRNGPGIAELRVARICAPYPRAPGWLLFLLVPINQAGMVLALPTRPRPALFYARHAA